MACPDCDNQQINTRYRVEDYPYVDDPGMLAKPVLLRVVVPVRECTFCGLEWKDHAAAIAVTNAIQRYHRKAVTF